MAQEPDWSSTAATSSTSSAGGSTPCPRLRSSCWPRRGAVPGPDDIFSKLCDADLTFPAALKVYLEWASTLASPSTTPSMGQEGLCRAEHVVYITTAGGPIGEQNFGFDYVGGLGRMLGIPQAHCLSAEGLDVWGNGPPGHPGESEGPGREAGGRSVKRYRAGGNGKNPSGPVFLPEGERLIYWT